MPGEPLAIDATKKEKIPYSRRKNNALKLGKLQLKKAKGFSVLMIGSAINVGMSIGLDVVHATCAMHLNLVR